MKLMRQANTGRLRLRSIASAVAGLALALLGGSAALDWNPANHPWFGFTLAASSPPWGSTVNQVDAGSQAALAGMREGDQVERPTALDDRLLLLGIQDPHPHEQITLTIRRAGERSNVTLRAQPGVKLSAIDGVWAILGAIAALVFLIAGLAMVLLRPSGMTWGLYLCSFTFAWLASFGQWPLQHVPSGWLLPLREVAIGLTGAGGVGFLVFCVRFPADAPTGWRKRLDHLAPYLAVATAGLMVSRDLAIDDFKPSAVIAFLSRAFDATWVSEVIVGVSVVLITYFAARGLERHKTKWVVLGLVCAFVPVLLGTWSSYWSVDVPTWITGLASLLLIPLPLAVAYAVIRHRVIDIRFILSRSLTIGVMASVVAVIVISLDWLFSMKLPSSHLEMAAYVGLALLVGFSANAARQRIGDKIDALFFRQWRQMREQAEAISDAVRRATSKADLYEPLTAGIAKAFLLSSAALFEQAKDGGFVRVAAHAWPTEALWHLLPDDRLAQRANETQRLIDLDAFQWRESELPTGVARPAMMVPIAASRMLAILLLGAHDSGTALDPEEMRTIRRLCADASIVYERSQTRDSARITVLGQHSEPLRA